jgi:hypothetical protein
MKKSKDFILDQEGDLLIRNSDFVIDFSDDQHVELLLSLNKGNLLEHPTTGYGIEQKLNSLFDLATSQRDIRLELERDGYEVKAIQLDEQGNISIDYNRIK